MVGINGWKLGGCVRTEIHLPSRIISIRARASVCVCVTCAAVVTCYPTRASRSLDDRISKLTDGRGREPESTAALGTRFSPSLFQFSVRRFHVSSSDWLTRDSILYFFLNV